MKAEDALQERKTSRYSEQKIASILAAAHLLFTRHGFGRTSMDAVAAAAQVGKATVYAHFGSKAELFRAVIADECKAHMLAFSPAPGEAIPDTLRRFGREAFALLLSPTTIAMFRMIAAEAARAPELGRIFYETGPAQLQAQLATLLERAMDTGGLRRAPPDVAASQFLSLISGNLQLRDFMGIGAGISPAEREAVLRSGIEAFLRAYAPIN